MFVRLPGSSNPSQELSLLKLPVVGRDRNSSSRLVNFLSSNSSFQDVLKRSQEVKSIKRLPPQKDARKPSCIRLPIGKDVSHQGLGPPHKLPRDKRPSIAVQVRGKSWRETLPPGQHSNVASMLESSSNTRRSSMATGKPTTQQNTASALQLSFNVQGPPVNKNLEVSAIDCHVSQASPERKLPTIHRPQPNHRPPEPQIRLRRIKPAIQDCCWAFCL